MVTAPHHPRLIVLAALVGSSVACEETRCRIPQAQAVDEERGCVQPAFAVPELRACTPYPPARGIRVFCLVDDGGQLYLVGGGDSERLSGDGWRYTGGTGPHALSPQEIERCDGAIEKAGNLDPADLCSS